MADEALEAKIAALSSKVEKESRFTRSLLVICTAAVLGVGLVPVKIMLSDLPKLLISEMMSNLEVIHKHWQILDKLPNNGSGNSGAAEAQ